MVVRRPKGMGNTLRSARGLHKTLDRIYEISANARAESQLEYWLLREIFNSPHLTWEEYMAADERVIKMLQDKSWH